MPVWDADAAVHRLYAAGGAGAAAVANLAPRAVAGGAVDRDRLRDAIIADPGLLARIEARVHPLVAADRAAFAAAHAGAGDRRSSTSRSSTRPGASAASTASSW